MTMAVHPTRALVVVAGANAASWLLATEGLRQVRGTLTLDSAVTAGIVFMGAAASAALGLLSLGAFVEGLLGWRPRAALALPLPLRRFVITSVATAVVASAAVPAHADEVYPGWAAPLSPSAGPTLYATSPEPSPSPVVTKGAQLAPAASEQAAPRSDTQPGPEPPALPEPREEVVELHAESSAPALGEDGDLHVVVRGDSLWKIATQELGPGATDAAIAEAWPAIYEANRDTIGEDPGLILPGQRLTIPHEVAR
jgi:hypothetical protein